MSYVDHGWRHQPGGSDPKMLGWRDANGNEGTWNVIRFGDNLTATEPDENTVRVDIPNA